MSLRTACYSITISVDSSANVGYCKGNRQVDILCYCVSSSHKLLQGTENYIKLHQIVDETVKKLQAEVFGLPVNMRRVIFWHCKAQKMNYPPHTNLHSPTSEDKSFLSKYPPILYDFPISIIV